MQHLILGSKSPRRAEILSFFHLPFEQLSPHFDEDTHPFKGDPLTYAKELAEGKAASLARLHPDRLILSADTVVFCDGKHLAKPATFEEHLAMIRFLNSKWNHVYTALTLCQGGKSLSSVDETKILFHTLTEEEIHAYCKGIDGSDRAGGFSIQGKGSLIAKKIEGCFYNAMGLPITVLRKLLMEFGINLWTLL